MRFNVVSIKNWIIPIFIAITVFAVFYPSLSGDFIYWDDDRYFLNNQNYRGLGIENIKWMFTESYENRIGMYIPLTWLTWGADYAIWGMEPRGYHLSNILIHIAGAIALFFLALKLITLACSTLGVAHWALYVGALFASLIWAIHPLRVESVAWITERKDVLSGFFYILTLILYVKYAESKKIKFYWLAFLMTVFALLSKPIAVSIPAILLILDAYPLRRFDGRSFFGKNAIRIYLEKLPFLIISVTSAIFTFWVHSSQIGIVTSLNVLGLSDRLLVIGHGLRFYFIKSIAPLNLAPLYDLTAQIDNIKEHIFFNYLFLIILSLFLFLLRKRLPGLFYAVLAGLLALFPVSGIMQAGPQIAADRFTYLPFMAIAIFIGGSVVFLLDSNFFKKYLISVRFIVIAGLIFSLIMLSNITRMQIEFWKDSISIWQHTVSLFPESGIARHHLGMAYNNIGNAFSRKGDHEMAIKNLKLAIESNPDYFEAYFNLANAFVLKSEFDEAIKYYQLLINDNPIYEPAYINLGVALFRAGDTKGALKVYEDALSKNPDFSGVRSNLTKMKKGLGISD